MTAQQIETSPIQETPVDAEPWDRLASTGVGLLLAAPLAVVLLLFVAYPLIDVFVSSVGGGAGIDRFIQVFTNYVSRRALITTLADSTIVVVVCVVLGSAIAWTLHTTGRRWLRVLLWTTALVPFWMGVVVKNYAVFLLLSANGPVNWTLLSLGIIERPIGFLFSKFAVIFGISYSLMPFAVLSLYATFSQVDTRLISAAETLGARRSQALATVAFPIARSGVAATMAIIFVLSIGFYVTPIMLGGAQSPYIATRIHQQIFSLYDFPGAAASAATILLIALLVVTIVFAVVGGRAFGKATMR